MGRDQTFVTTGELARLVGCSPQAILRAEREGRIRPPTHWADTVRRPRLRLYTRQEAAHIAGVITRGKRDRPSCRAANSGGDDGVAAA